MHDERENSKSQGPRVGGLVETVDIARIAGGDTARGEFMQDLLRSLERIGCFRIVRMDDEAAVLEWVNDAMASLLSSAGRA